ncbi:MAG: hypothetical protein ACREQ9_18795, partial [Candidatus Binatia bacterium]
CPGCGRLLGRRATPGGFDLPQPRREEPSETATNLAPSTLVSAILLIAAVVPAAPWGLWAFRRGAELARSEGSDFFWGLDALVAAAAGLVLILFAAAIAALVALALAGAVGLLRRAPWARTAALFVFVATAVTAGSALTVAPSAETAAALVIGVAGGVLLFVPPTDRDFGGRWGSWLLKPRRRLFF